MSGGGGSKEVDAGTWYFVATHEGLSLGPVDAFLEWRASTQVAWTGELTASGVLNINKPGLFGGEKDQGGVVGKLRVMFGDADQVPNTYLTGVFGNQTGAWRGFLTVAWEGGKYGANNPYPQKPSYKIRKIKKGWDNDVCWYPEKAQIVLVAGEADSAPIEFNYAGGESFPSVTNVLIGAANGTIYLDYSTGPNPDKFEVWVGGAKVIDTGYHGKGSDINAATGNTFQTDLDAYLTAHGLPTESIIATPGSDIDANTQWVNNRETASFVKSTYDSVATVKVYSPLTGTIWKAALRRDAVAGAVGQYAMNPAHILYFLQTGLERGREPVANMADDNLRAAADYWYSKGFGLCGTRKAATVSPAEYIQQIERVAGCSFSRSTLDGKWYIDIANGEYDLESLPILNDDDILDFKEIPTVLDNAINSVSVRYFDQKQKRAITTPAVRALALIAAFGENHQTLDFLEIPDAATANDVAERELLAATTPTRRFDIPCKRKVEGWRRFQYFRMQLFKRGIADMVCMVGEAIDGKLKSGGIQLKAIQHTASVATATYVQSEPGVDTRSPQTPVAIATQRAFEAPYIDICTRFSSSELANLSDDAGFLAALGLDPAASRDFTLYVAPHSGAYVEYGSEDFCPTATINEAVTLDGSGAAPATSFTFSDGVALQTVVVGMPAIWGTEWCRVDAIDVDAGTVTLGRGCADTVPQDHAAGERIFFYADHAASDGKEHTAGETVDVKLLTNTGSARLAEGDATAMNLTFDQRQARPYPPGKPQIGGTYYPAAVADEFTVTWTHRNRELQADQLVDTTMASVALPTNTRYGLRFLDASDALIVEQLDIGAATATVKLNYTGNVTMELYAIDDTAESMQRHNITFAYTGTGPSAITATAYTPEYDGIIVDGGA